MATCIHRNVIGVVVIGTLFIGCNEPETSTTTVAQDPTVQQRVGRILASDEIIFAHDHLRDLDHIQGALTGHMTAMTIELTVDQMKFVEDLNLDCAHRTEVKTCCGGVQDNTCFANDTDERAWFDAARMELVNTLGMPQLNGQVSIVNTVDDIDAARAANQLGIIIGTEGALATGGSLANVDALYQLGWRKMQFRHAQFNAFAAFGHLTPLGKQLQATLNRRGIVVDTMHLTDAEIDDVLAIANAPVLVSHQWQRGLYLTTGDNYLLKQTYSGGGHGVIALNALGVFYIDLYEHTMTNDAGVQIVNTIPPECRLPDRRGYSHSPDPAPATIVNFLDRLNCLILLVGVDHVAIGPDFMPEGDKYAIGGGLRDQIPNLGTNVGANPGSVPDLVTALVTDPAGYTDDDIKKILGGNLRDLYQRVWDPTHHYDGGQAHFQLCADGSTDPICVAAASNGGQGDLHHRAINCQHPSGHQPVGLQLSYIGGHWQFRDLAGNLVTCVAGSTLVVSWADATAPANAHLGIYDTASCDAACQAATTSAGAGTVSARALSCASNFAPGIIGLQLGFSGGVWSYYTIFAQLVACASNSTWIANWGAGVTPNASVRLCDDANGHPDCVEAAANNGAGTSRAKPLSCLNSTPDPAWFGGVALEVAYTVDPSTGTSRWSYWDAAGHSHPCVHGSVLIATTP